jgi:chromosome segregation ATPase
MDRVRAWNEPAHAQLLAAAEAEVTTLKRRLANCEEALRQKVTSLTEAEKGQAELRKALAAKEAELVAVHQEAADERRRSTDTNYLRGKLRNAEADMKTDIEYMWERWERVQSRLVAEVERTNEENARLTQALSDQQAKAQKERDVAESRHRQSQA